MNRDALCAKIRGFSENGAEATPPTPAVGAVCKLISELPKDAPMPLVSPAAGGEIGMTWINGSKRINAAVYEDCHLIWVKRLGLGRFEPGAEIDLNVESCPRQLIDDLTALSGPAA